MRSQVFRSPFNAYCTTPMARVFKWPARNTVQDMLAAASPYISEHLLGEAVLNIGAPLLAWSHGHIDSVIRVGPLECMSNKIAENPFFIIVEQEGLHSLTLKLNGDPVDLEIIDNFA